jgi:hypothetical protein
MRNFNCWTCGHYTYRLKDTTHKKADGSYSCSRRSTCSRDYQFSVDNRIALPPREELTPESRVSNERDLDVARAENSILASDPLRATRS